MSSYHHPLNEEHDMIINAMPLWCCALVVCATMSAGCTTTQVSRDAVPVRAFDINLIAMRGQVTVNHTDGRVVGGITHFNIARDTAMWTDASELNPTYASIASIRSIRVNDRLTGLTYGVLGGMAAGIVTNMALMEGFDNGRGLAYLTGGYVIGGLLGYLIGVSRDFEFVDAR